MPVITVKLWDLERIARGPLPDDLRSVLEALKLEVEELGPEELTYEAPHDRADLFSAEGLGRALGIFLGYRGPPSYKVKDGRVRLDITRAPEYRPYAFGAVVKNLELDDEAIRQLFQLQEKLAISYGNKREVVSIGLYDLDKLSPRWEEGLTIEYKALREGRMVPLGYSEEMTFEEVLEKTEKGKEYGRLVVKGRYPAFVSEDKIMSFAPILNAEDYKVDERTKNVFVDVTGTVPEVMLRVLDVMVTSLAERSPEPEIQRVEVVGANMKTPRLKYKKVRLDKEAIKRVAGFKLEGLEELLKRMGLVVEGEWVTVPPYRIDVFSEVDLAEDALSAYGYNKVPAEALPPTHWGSRDYFKDYLARLLTSMGLEEVFNFVLIDKELVEELLGVEPVEVSNPRMKSYSALRPSLVPSLLLTIKQNQEALPRIEVFEVGPVVLKDKTLWRLGVAVAGDKVTLTDVGAILRGLALALNLRYSLEEIRVKPFIEGRAAAVIMDGKVVGVMGEVHPEHLQKVGVELPTAVLELDVDALR